MTASRALGARLALLGLGAALVAGAAGAYASGSATPPPRCTPNKPDLVVTDADLAGRPYTFRGIQGEHFTWRFTADTKNICRAPAGASRTGVKLTALHHAAREYMTATKATPALAGGESAAAQGPQSGYTMRAAPADAYGIEVCADVNERVDEKNELNNCREVKGGVYIADKTWKGSLNGSASPFGNASKESWKSIDAKLGFVDYIGGGVFTYDFTGDVTWQMSGGSNQCTYTGGPGTATMVGNDFPGVTIDYAGYTYTGGFDYSGSNFYDITITCGGQSSQTRGPIFREFLNLNANGHGQKLSRDEEGLTGTTYDSVRFATWHWNLQPGWR
jgi:hypothetical protein